MLTINQLQKRFGDKTAVDIENYTIAPGTMRRESHTRSFISIPSVLPTTFSATNGFNNSFNNIFSIFLALNYAVQALFQLL